MDLNKASESGTGNRLAEPSAGLDPGGGGSAGSRRSSSNRTTEYCLEHRKSATDTAVLKSGSEMVATAGADGDVKVGTAGPPPLKSPVSLGRGWKRSFFKFPLLFERASQTWCVLTIFFCFIL